MSQSRHFLTAGIPLLDQADPSKMLNVVNIMEEGTAPGGNRKQSQRSI